MPIDDGLLKQIYSAGAQSAQAAQENLLKQQQMDKAAQIDQEQRAARLNALKQWLSTQPKEITDRGINIETGSIGARESENNLAKLAQLQEMQMRRQLMQDDKLEKRVTEFGKRLESAEIPVAETLVSDLESITPPEGESFKSYGPFLNAVPNSAVGILEKVGLLPAGAYNERQVLESAKLLPRHKVFGASLTGSEKASAETALGAGIGQSEADLRRTLNRLKSIPSAARQNIEQSTDPAAVNVYNQRNIAPAQLKVPAPAAVDNRRARLEQLRALKASKGK